jgi:hypothetical protein
MPYSISTEFQRYLLPPTTLIWWQKIPLKHQYTTDRPHGVASQNTVIFTTTKPSDLMSSTSFERRFLFFEKKKKRKKKMTFQSHISKILAHKTTTESV